MSNNGISSESTLLKEAASVRVPKLQLSLMQKHSRIPTKRMFLLFGEHSRPMENSVLECSNVMEIAVFLAVLVRYK